MKKFLFLLVMLAMALGGGWLTWQKIQHRKPPVAKTLPTLPKPSREFRFAVLGRPSELPLRALARMPELQDLPVKFIVCSSPAQRWLMLASGQADVAIASSDELAMALPRYGLDVKVFPLALQQGNEQVVFSKDGNTPPWIAYLPGGVGQSLALHLKDPQLKLVAVENPDQATAMLKAGQIRGCSLWNPWLDQAKGQGFEGKGEPSSGLEVWVWSSLGSETGRVSEEDGQKVVRAWFDLMRQLSDKPALTHQAIAEENEVNVTLIPASLLGLQFYPAATLLNERTRLAEDLRSQMKEKVNLWSLAGQPVGGDVSKLQVDLDWLVAVGLEGEATTSPVELPGETPAPSASVTPTPTTTDVPTETGDPFDKPPPEGATPSVTQAGGDAGRSGRMPGPPLVSEPKQLWAAALPAEPTTPVVASPDGQQLFVGLANGNLCCVERASGRVMWNFPMDERIRSAPACQGQWVEAACDSGQIVSIERSTGVKRWSVQASSDVQGPLAIDEGALYAATVDGQILCLDVGSGVERWTQVTGTNITAGLAVTSQHVVACCIDKKVRVLRKDSGTKAWEVSLGDACRATPSVESGLIMVGCADHNFYGLREYDGSVAWKQKLPEEVACASVSLGRNVYVGCKDNNVYCLDRGTGKKVWTYPTRERVVNDLVGCSDTLYVVSQDMRLYALQASDPKLRFKLKQSAWLQTPWVQDQIVYLPVADNTLRALK
ncbi:PQQ-binding-like beta-propeller repeat protein [bacterium]|nr:PQQ-binding-like beta-propeller repeat protein [bacterium]